MSVEIVLSILFRLFVVVFLALAQGICNNVSFAAEDTAADVLHKHDEVNMKRRYLCQVYIWLGVLVLSLGLAAQVKFDRYHKPEEVNKALRDYAAAGGNTRIHKLAQSPGGIPLLMIEIGPEAGKKEK